MAETLPKSLTVKGMKGDSYTFRIPALYDEFRVAARAKDIRKATDPEWDGFDDGLSLNASWAIRAAAVFDTQLESTSATWVHTKGLDGKPVVDSSTFPPDKVDEVLFVHRGYLDAVARFRTTGSPDEPPAPSETVASERAEEDAPVQP